MGLICKIFGCVYPRWDKVMFCSRCGKMADRFEIPPPLIKKMTMEENKCTLTNAELIVKCNEWVSKLARTGGQAWTLRVPVDFNNDPDMLFCELGKRLEEYDEMEDRFCLILDHASMGNMSKSNYTVEAMKSVIDDAQQKHFYSFIKSDLEAILNDSGTIDDIKEYINQKT
jgi:hypothetical protein